MNRLVIVLIIILSPFQLLFANQKIIPLNHEMELIPIGQSVKYFRDNQYLSIHDVLRDDVSDQFQDYIQDVPNFASTGDAVWFSFQVKAEDAGSYYLNIGSAFMDSVEFYKVTEAGPELVSLTGDALSFDTRDVGVTTIMLPIIGEVGEVQTYYLRVKSLQPLFFSLRVGTIQSLMEDTHLLDYVQGIYFGFMMLIFLYNLFLFISTKERLYLYYVAYVFSITLFMAFIFQYVFEYVWPNTPIINTYAVLSSSLTMFSAIFFTQQFLHTRDYAPKLHKGSYLFIGVASVIAILMFTPFKIQALQFAQGGIFLMAIYFMVMGIYIRKQGYKPATYYLLAWGFMIFGFMGAMLESVNLVPVMHYLNHMQIGSAIEVTLLSLALANRINIHKKEKEEAQALALKAEEEKVELLSKQNETLELKVKERTVELESTLKEVDKQRAKSEELLLNILPYSTAQELKEKGTSVPRHYDSVSVLFTDIKGFTKFSESHSASELVGYLDDMFKSFDDIIKKYNLEKIKTIGDAYMAACGIPNENRTHARDAIYAALEMQRLVKEKGFGAMNDQWELRCGIHTGPVTAGVVGKHKFAYDIWGDTVNTASRMESSGMVGKVNVSEFTIQHLNGSKSEFHFEHRGLIDMKGKSPMNMYFVDWAK